MDDLAPAPLQRTPEEGGRQPEEVFPVRRKLSRKAPPEPVKEPNPEVAKDSEHQLDVLA
jgi:hypothetical protein